MLANLSNDGLTGRHRNQHVTAALDAAGPFCVTEVATLLPPAAAQISQALCSTSQDMFHQRQTRASQSQESQTSFYLRSLVN